MALYRPFTTLDFRFDQCFLSGNNENLIQNAIIPPFLLQHGQLKDKQIQLLDERKIAFQDLYLPCNTEFLEKHLLPLDQKILKAFEIGYAAVQQLDPNDLFLWVGKLVYGFIYNELHGVLKQAHIQAEAPQIPQGLIHKFGNLHLMLQKIHAPLHFDGFSPFSMVIYPLNEPVPFSFKDDINSLTFSMKMNDFGLIVLLQDNANTNAYLSKKLIPIQDKTLSLMQFEEVCANYYYASYLMNKLPEYDVLDAHSEIYLDARPLAGLANKALYDPWQQKTYAQVLEKFWEPWGYTLFEILKNPEEPLSFLKD